VPKLPSLVVAIAALALGLGACGGSSSNSSSSSTPAASASTASTPAPATAGSSGGLALSADPSGQLKFSTTSLSAKAGTVAIAFSNSAPEGHNLTVVQGSGGAVIGATPTFTGGSKTLTLHLKPGTYTFYCSVPGHRAGGMQGTLIVK
jgi:plastocyanin